MRICRAPHSREIERLIENCNHARGLEIIALSELVIDARDKKSFPARESRLRVARVRPESKERVPNRSYERKQVHASLFESERD